MPLLTLALPADDNNNSSNYICFQRIHSVGRQCKNQTLEHVSAHSVNYSQNIMHFSLAQLSVCPSIINYVSFSSFLPLNFPAPPISLSDPSYQVNFDLCTEVSWLSAYCPAVIVYKCDCILKSGVVVVCILHMIPKEEFQINESRLLQTTKPRYFSSVSISIEK